MTQLAKLDITPTSQDASATLAPRLAQKYPDRVTGAFVIPAREGCYVDLPASLPDKLADALKARGRNRLYSHQGQCCEAVDRGEDVVVVTPTASGKSLCYTLPVVSAAMQGGGKSLYLFPTKALAQDQVAELIELSKAGELGIRAATFDGDTPGDQRQAIRLSGDVVVTNPDMLHQGILPHHTKWAQLFENLKFVVIDEIHAYRGVFGSHLAIVLRRLERICAFYGSRPQFIMCSATIGNPQEHAEALLGRPVTAITESGAPSGEKHVLLWNPPVVNPDLGLRASARSQSNRIARMAIRAGLKTLVFAQSRTMVEVLTKYLKDVFDHDPRKPARIRAYRGGYLPTERRDAERAMRDGRIDGIVSTSALEVGVDIGSLDVVILNGYPGSVSGTWQRFGRAGRRQKPSLGVLVASSDPLDQYIVRHPEFFSEASPEHARIAPDQPVILLDHIRCAAFELPFLDGDAFGPVDPLVFLQLLAEDGVLHTEGGRWEWIADSYPAIAVNLRSVADGNFVVVDRTDGRQTIIAEVDFSATPRHGHEIDDRLYSQKDFDRSLVIDQRTQRVAKWISDYLKQSGDRLQKNIVFCVDTEHAARMAPGAGQRNPDLIKLNPRYVMRMTGDDAEGTAQLGNFIDPESPYPALVTTSRLLSTGVDAQTCRLIVLDREVSSMTEFKQIVGRGTRVQEDAHKYFFTLVAFRKATNHFADPDFDGEPVQIYQPGEYDPPVPPDEVPVGECEDGQPLPPLPWMSPTRICSGATMT